MSPLIPGFAEPPPCWPSTPSLSIVQRRGVMACSRFILATTVDKIMQTAHTTEVVRDLPRLPDMLNAGRLPLCRIAGQVDAFVAAQAATAEWTILLGSYTLGGETLLGRIADAAGEPPIYFACDTTYATAAVEAAARSPVAGEWFAAHCSCGSEELPLGPQLEAAKRCIVVMPPPQLAQECEAPALLQQQRPTLVIPAAGWFRKRKATADCWSVLHTRYSGHGDVAELQELIAAVKPARLLPLEANWGLPGGAPWQILLRVLLGKGAPMAAFR